MARRNAPPRPAPARLLSVPSAAVLGALAGLLLFHAADLLAPAPAPSAAPRSDDAQARAPAPAPPAPPPPPPPLPSRPPAETLPPAKPTPPPPSEFVALHRAHAVSPPPDEPHPEFRTRRLFKPMPPSLDFETHRGVFFGGWIARWGELHVLASAEECAGACVSYNEGWTDGFRNHLFCNAFRYCHDAKLCGSHLGECWLLFQPRLLSAAPDVVPEVDPACPGPWSQDGGTAMECPFISGMRRGPVLYATGREAEKAADTATDCVDGTVNGTGAFCVEASGEPVGWMDAIDWTMARTLATRVLRGVSVVDVGAGLGRYATVLRNPNLNGPRFYAAYDGSSNIERVTNGVVKHVDLTRPLDEPLGVFDWALCLEVAEHVPAEHSDAFLDKLDAVNTQGVVLSWAPPGQGGHFHVNEQPPEHAIARMAARGYAVDQALTDELRGSANAHGCCFYFKRSVFVFRRSSAAGRRLRLRG